MNKPLTMIIKETRIKLANICNESGLPPIILDLIMQGVYSEVHSLAEKQTSEEEMAYVKMLEENKQKEDLKEGLAKSRKNQKIQEGETNE